MLNVEIHLDEGKKEEEFNHLILNLSGSIGDSMDNYFESEKVFRVNFNIYKKYRCSYMLLFIFLENT